MIFKQKDKVEDIFKKIQNKNLIKRYLNLIIGCSLLAFAFDVFFAPKNIVYGGVAGVSIVINRLFGIDKSLFVLIVSAILLVISYFTLGPEKTKGSMAGSIIYPICIKIFEPVAASIDLNIDDTLLIVMDLVQVLILNLVFLQEEQILLIKLHQNTLEYPLENQC